MVTQGQAESCNKMVVTVTGVCQNEWQLSRLPATVVRGYTCHMPPACVIDSTKGFDED